VVASIHDGSQSTSIRSDHSFLKKAIQRCHDGPLTREYQLRRGRAAEICTRILRLGKISATVGKISTTAWHSIGCRLVLFLATWKKMIKEIIVNKIVQAFSIAATLMGLTASVALADSSAALKALDPDNDGTIDLKEADAGAAKVFKDINSDNDGTVDAKELAGRLDAADFKAADPDNDGTLDEKEYMALVAKKFKVADPDNDGTVDLKELDSPAGQALLKLIY
jgi:Ca2+-binding EF-hand superfamily protein